MMPPPLAAIPRGTRLLIPYSSLTPPANTIWVYNHETRATTLPPASITVAPATKPSLLENACGPHAATFLDWQPEKRFRLSPNPCFSAPLGPLPGFIVRLYIGYHHVGKHLSGPPDGVSMNHLQHPLLWVLVLPLQALALDHASLLFLLSAITVVAERLSSRQSRPDITASKSSSLNMDP